jgi:hypothetical protein
MKHKIFYILVFSFLLLIISCSASKPPVEYSYQYIDKTRQYAYTEVYKYKYKISDGEWQDIDIYVKYDKRTYVINIENYFGQMQNQFIYNSLKKTQNFTSQYRAAVPETVYSLQEAIELALGMYIQDFKAKEVAKSDSTK